MNAIQVNTIGPSATFRYAPVNNPPRVDNEVLIKLEAIGVNPLEQTIRLGYFPTSMLPPFIPGSEGAGTVVEAAGEFLPGDRVFILGGGHGISNQGTYAEYVSVNKNWVVPMPPGMSFEEAAAFGVATLTAWLVLHRAAKIKSSETVLILGASGGVGMMAVQLAKLAGAQVIASVGHQDKFSTARELGAEAVVVTDSTLGKQLAETGRQIDVIIDLVGGTHLGQALHSAKPRARAVIVGYSAAPTSLLNIIDILRNEIVISGFNLFAADPADIGAAITDMMSIYAQGKIKVLVDRVYPLSEAEAATQHRLSRNGFGRVVLKPEHA